MTRVAGPVVLPVVVLASLIALNGAFRLAGSLRWASLASAAALGDVVLTLAPTTATARAASHRT